MKVAAVVSGRLWTLALLLCMLAACDRASRADRDSTVRDTVIGAAKNDRPADWATELGSALVVPGDSEQTGLLLYPAAPPQWLNAGGILTLLSPSGDSMSTPALRVASDSVCGEAPTLRLTGSLGRPWSVGLLGRKAAVLAMDSIEVMTPADSARMVADLARMASALPGANDPRFVGLPFVVVSARRFSAPDRQFLVAQLVRRLPQEATPLEERVLLIADRDRAAAGSSFYTTYHLRSSGTEETADHYDVLAALRGDAAVYVLLVRDQEARTTYEVLERMPTSGWRVRWSRVLEC